MGGKVLCGDMASLDRQLARGLDDELGASLCDQDSGGSSEQDPAKSHQQNQVGEVFEDYVHAVATILRAIGCGGPRPGFAH